MNDRIFELREQLKLKLNPMRYEHSLSVSFTCIGLAMRYGYDLNQAELAGLLHDCAKPYDNQSIISKCREQHIELTDDELKAPAVLHAKFGVWVAEHKYRITDTEILNAIRWHTTGKAAMSLLEKITFVADYIEPRRCQADGLSKIRKLAYLDLDETMYQILKGTLVYLESKECYIDSLTKIAYEYYKQERENKA